jgi:predicted kinase
MSWMADVPVLIVIGGLPGTGKSTVAGVLVRQTRFAYLRVDRIEQAIIDAMHVRPPLGPAGYLLAYGVAAEQLRHGVGVVVECVNPLAVTRDAWRGVARDAEAGVLEVELVCTDLAEHRNRVQTRAVDIPGLTLPTWSQVVDRDYEPWDRDHLVIDTATQPPAAAAETIRRAAAAIAGTCSG